MPAGGQTIHPVVRRRNGRGATGRRRPARPSAPWAAGQPQHPVHAAVQAQRIVFLQGGRQQRVREVVLRATGHVIGTEALPTSLLLMLLRGTRLQQVDNEGTTRSETAVVEPAGRLGADLRICCREAVRCPAALKLPAVDRLPPATLFGPKISGGRAATAPRWRQHQPPRKHSTTARHLGQP